MSKRRTRKQKEKAKHQFKLSWEPTSINTVAKDKTSSPKAVVKGQTKRDKKTEKLKNRKTKYAYITADYENLGTIRHNLIRSLLIASLILSLELVLYFKWS
jgi:hypothetical protein